MIRVRLKRIEGKGKKNYVWLKKMIEALLTRVHGVGLFDSTNLCSSSANSPRDYIVPESMLFTKPSA